MSTKGKYKSAKDLGILTGGRAPKTVGRKAVRVIDGISKALLTRSMTKKEALEKKKKKIFTVGKFKYQRYLNSQNAFNKNHYSTLDIPITPITNTVAWTQSGPVIKDLK